MGGRNYIGGNRAAVRFAEKAVTMGQRLRGNQLRGREQNQESCADGEALTGIHEGKKRYIILHYSSKRKSSVPLEMGTASCHWLPAICGGVPVNGVQTPEARLVQDITVKPAAASGQNNVTLVPAKPTFVVGLAWLNNWFAPSACVAAISLMVNAPL